MLLLLVVLPSNVKNHQGVGGIVVSIAAFQAVDPGSIPGQRKLFTMEFAIETLFHIMNCSSAEFNTMNCGRK